jgi:3-isopropylmalate/(R)-2-methylmalate dehydratase small subunit
MSDNIITGKAYVLGDDIDTDQIIPAQYLVYNLDDPAERMNYGKYALSGVPAVASGLPDGSVRFSDPETGRGEYSLLVAGKNFGCGSSREHAPVALQVAGIRVVIARSYARIFYRNAVDGAYVIPYESSIPLNEIVKTGDTVELDTVTSELIHTSGEGTERYTLDPLGDVRDIIEAGGLFAYARKSGMLMQRV